MTEADWLACADVTAMLTFLEGRVSARKLRLFGVACCDRVWHLLTDSRSRKAVRAAMRFADGEVTDRERHEAYLAARAVVEEAERRRRGPPEVDRTPALQAAVAARNAAGVFRSASDLAAVATPAARARRASQRLSTLARRLDPPGVLLETSSSERAAQAALLRDLIGPFERVEVRPRWRDATVIAMARACYEGRDFASLPILADALEDAGCDDVTLLEHLRDGDPHARGCWALDALLLLS